MSDLDKFFSPTGDYLTQSLFLELGYEPSAIYTLKERDHKYKGKVYPSIKQLYLQMEDPTEYSFAKEHFASWKQWQRIVRNKKITPYIEEWREELEVKLRSQAIVDIIATSAEASQGSFQAAKWLADRGWEKRAPGRPSKEAKEREEAIEDRIQQEFKGDIIRMNQHRK